MSKDIEKLRLKAAQIRPYVCAIASSAIAEHIGRNAAKIVTEGTEEELRHYLEYATDPEVVALLSDLSLTAPLGEHAFKIYMHLFSDLCRDAGIAAPSGLLQQPGKLDTFHLSILNDIKRKIRSRQNIHSGKAKISQRKPQIANSMYCVPKYVTGGAL